MQLLDHQHLLLKYVNLDNMVTQKHVVTVASRPVLLNTSGADFQAYSQIGPVATITASLNPNGAEGRDNTNEVINSGVAIIATNSNHSSTARITNRTSNANPSSNPRSSNVRSQNSVIIQSQPSMNAPTNRQNDIQTGGEAMATLPVIMNENTVPFYFVLYDMKNARILNVLRNTSSHLLNVYENFQVRFLAIEKCSLTNKTNIY